MKVYHYRFYGWLCLSLGTFMLFGSFLIPFFLIDYYSVMGALHYVNPLVLSWSAVVGVIAGTMLVLFGGILLKAHTEAVPWRRVLSDFSKTIMIKRYRCLDCGSIGYALELKTDKEGYSHCPKCNSTHINVWV